jgi:thiol-disulfide isomerase/thioredoxin
MNRSTGVLVAAVCLSAAAGFGVYRGWSWWNGRAVDGQWAPPVATADRLATRGEAVASTAGPGAGDGQSSLAQGSGSQAGSSAATDGAPATPASIPDEVPDLTMPDMDGHRHALRSYRGKPVIYNFWASWCAPCRREIPLLNTIQHQAGTKTLNVIGIAADLRANVVEFTKTTRMDYPLLVGEEEGAEAAQRFGVPLVLPFSVFVASSGRVVALKLGELHQDEATAILAVIRHLDQGRTDLAGARQQIADRLRELAVERARAQATQG